jgi:hypothetical protein
MAGGRPRGAWSDKQWRDAIRHAVNEKEKHTGEKRLRLLALRLIENAMGGDTAALKEVGDRLDGKAAQTLDVAVTDERTVIRAPEPAQTAEEWRASLPKPH